MIEDACEDRENWPAQRNGNKKENPDKENILV